MNTECSICGAIKCYKHCDNCGKNIYFRKNEYSEKWVMCEEGTEIEHRCMGNGTSDGKYHNRKLPDEYSWDDSSPLKRIVRCGNSPVFKCLYCGKRGDLPIMKTHHLKDECLIKQKQEEWKEAEKEKPIVDLKNQRMDAFIQKVESVWTV